MAISELQLLLTRVAILCVLIAAVLLGSWLLSHLVPGFLRVIEETLHRSRGLRRRLSRVSRIRFRRHGEALWAQVSAEPVRPVAAQLSRLADAAENSGEKQIRKLQRVESRFSAHVERLAGLSVGSNSGLTFDVDRLRQSAQSARGGLVMAIVLFLLTLVIVAINTFVLFEFFRSIFPSQPLLPYPMPQFEIAHVFALLFTIFEVAAGMMIHAYERSSQQQFHVMLFRNAPLIGIGVLSLIEWFAYAVLSVNVGMPARLGMAQESAFYPIAQYFLAPFGPALTIMLAALGYALWNSVAVFGAGRSDLKILKSFKRFSERAKEINGQLEAAGGTLTALQGSASEFRLSVVQEFQAAKGVSPETDTIARQLRDRSDHLLQGGPAEAAVLPRRRRTQAVGSTAMDLLIVGLWALLAYVLFHSLFTVLAEWRGVGSGAVAAGIALGITLLAASMGYVIKDSLTGATYASPTTSSVAGKTGRRLLAASAAITLISVAALSAWSAVRMQALSDIAWVNALYGLAIVAGISVLAFNLDAGIVALLRFLQVLALGVAAAAVLCYVLVSLAFEAVLFLLGQSLKLAAVPGEWVRTLRSPARVAHEVNI